MAGPASVGLGNVLRNLGIKASPSIAGHSQAVLCHAARVGYKAATVTRRVASQDNGVDKSMKPLGEDMVIMHTARTDEVYGQPARPGGADH